MIILYFILIYRYISMKNKKYTTKERFKILESTVATLYVGIEKLSKRIDGIDEFLTKATKDFKDE